MSDIQAIKQKVANLLEEKGLNANAVSLQMGYERSYLKQFITKENPKRLSDKARRALAVILDVSEQDLTDEDLSMRTFLPASFHGVANISESLTKLFRGPATTPQAHLDIIDVEACCGNGKECLSEKSLGQVSIPLDTFKSITNTSPDKVKLIKASGDSMEPTIKDSDMVWVDTSNNFISSDGIYLLKMPTGLAIKRVQAGMSDITVKSDNPKYSDITSSVEEVNVIGKVVYIWNGRKV